MLSPLGDWAHINLHHAEKIAEVEGLILTDPTDDYVEERLLSCGSKLVITKRKGRRRAVLYGYADQSILRFFTEKYNPRR